MLVNAANLTAIFDGFNTRFNEGLEGVTSHYRTVAMVVPSQGREEHYAWLGQFPGLREWLGDRVVHSLALHDFTIPNRKFETTISVPREGIEDDRISVFGPMFTELGRVTGEHPDTLVFELLSRGFTDLCYDGQPFFDTDHPVPLFGEGPPQSVSNMQAGSEPAWFLLDLSRAIKPLVWQERIPYRLSRLDRDEDENVFARDEFIYGVRARANAGFGLWQMAFASKAELTTANYAAARVAMSTLRGDHGRLLGVRPTHLVVPPALEQDALELLSATSRVIEVNGSAVAAPNVWSGTAELIVTPHLAE